MIGHGAEGTHTHVYTYTHNQDAIPLWVSVPFLVIVWTVAVVSMTHSFIETWWIRRKFKRRRTVDTPINKP